MRDAITPAGQDALEGILQDILAETGIPGIGMALSVRGKTLSIASGISALDTGTVLAPSSHFEMSCLMKFFVSLIVLDLADAGMLDLNAPVTALLPEIQIGHDGKSEDITLRHLLSHTSGYRGLDITDMKVRWNYSWDKFVAHFLESSPSFPPGSTFNYEHSEHVVIGEILRRVTGLTARDLVRNRILTPLGIETGSARSNKNDSARFVANHVSSPASGIFSTVSLPPFGPFWDASLPDCTIALHDVIRVADALLGNVSESAVEPIFSPSVLAQLVPSVIALPQGIRSDRQSEQIPHSFGIGCAQYDGTVLGHNGSMLGQTCALRFDPRIGAAVIIGVNARSIFARDTALQRIWAVVSDAPAPYQRPVPSRIFHLDDMLSDFTLDQVSGHYVGSYLGEVTVAREEDRLRFDIGPSGNRRTSFRITPAGDNRVYEIESKSPVSAIFARDAASNGPTLFLGVHSYKKVS